MTDPPRGDPEFFERIQKGIDESAEIATSGKRSRLNGHHSWGERDEPLDLGEWNFGEDNEPIPPRGWLLGNLLCRQFLTSIFADGAVGKTALMIAMALSLATGKKLIGEHVFVRCPVLLVSSRTGRTSCGAVSPRQCCTTVQAKPIFRDTSSSPLSAAQR